MLKKRKILLLLLAGVVSVISMSLSGCALLMPYSVNYSCPESKSDMGNCSSLVDNYKLSTHPNQLKKLADARKVNKHNCPVSLQGTKACKETETASGSQHISGKNINLSATIPVSQYLLKYMLKTTTPPLYVPAVIKKIWILPYSSKKVFHSGSNIFIVIKSGKWLYGNYLYKKYNKLNMFKIQR
jgi:type IV conjugative transfer system lipoprotein TraV